MASFDNKYYNNNNSSTAPATAQISISGKNNGYGNIASSSATLFGSAPAELRLWSSPAQPQNYGGGYELGAGDMAAIRQLYNSNRTDAVQEAVVSQYPSSATELSESAVRRYAAAISTTAPSLLRGFPTVAAAVAASGREIREISHGYMNMNEIDKNHVMNSYGVTTAGSMVNNESQFSGDDNNTVLQRSDSINGGQMLRSLKKRKLSEEQARRLEASFEADRKLEGEKKQRLAEELGLDARQIAVWFQNRRARSKTKQLEHDFLALQASYRDVLAQRQYLRDQIAKLTSQLRAKHGEVESTSRSTSSTNSSNDDLKLGSTQLHANAQSITNKNFIDMSANTYSDSKKCNDSNGQVENSTRPTTMNHTETWRSYDDNLWVFD